MGTYSMTVNRPQVASLSKIAIDALPLFATLVVVGAVLVGSLVAVGVATNSVVMVVTAGLMAVVATYFGLFAGLNLVLNRK